jgi:hypothetical protein
MYSNPNFKLKWSQTNDLKMSVKVHKNTKELLGSGELLISNKFFGKKEDSMKKWINLNNPSVVKKSKLSLLDQIKVNLYIDIYYDVNNINEISESVKTSLTAYTEKSQSNKHKDGYNTTRKSAVMASLSNNNSFLKSFDNKLDLTLGNKLITSRGGRIVPGQNVLSTKVKKKSADDRIGRSLNNSRNILIKSEKIDNLCNSVKMTIDRGMDVSSDSEKEESNDLGQPSDDQQIDSYIHTLDEFRNYYNDGLMSM